MTTKHFLSAGLTQYFLLVLIFYIFLWQKQELAAWTYPGNLLEMHNQKPLLKPIESKSIFLMNPQGDSYAHWSLRSIYLAHWFSNFSVHPNHLGGLLKYRFLSCNSRILGVVWKFAFLTIFRFYQYCCSSDSILKTSGLKSTRWQN